MDNHYVECQFVYIFNQTLQALFRISNLPTASFQLYTTFPILKKKIEIKKWAIESIYLPLFVTKLTLSMGEF